ncbi:MAG: monovalent cation/H+ antiporter complex subunit F [Actinomycetota bacterium]
MIVITTFCLAVLAVAGLICVASVVTGPSVARRVLALDTFLIVVVVGVAIGAVHTRDGVYLDALLLVALVAFIGTTAVGRFIERRGSR